MSATLEVTMPLAKPLPSAANLREHWAVKAKRVKAQRMRVQLALAPLVSMDMRYLVIKGARIECTLTRIASRELDSDNLQAAFKATRDQVAAVMCLDDGSKRWTWRYAEERGSPAVRIRLEVAS